MKKILMMMVVTSVLFIGSTFESYSIAYIILGAKVTTTSGSGGTTTKYVKCQAPFNKQCMRINKFSDDNDITNDHNVFVYDDNSNTTGEGYTNVDLSDYLKIPDVSEELKINIYNTSSIFNDFATWDAASSN
jgi:hypothetical protein